MFVALHEEWEQAKKLEDDKFVAADGDGDGDGDAHGDGDGDGDGVVCADCFQFAEQRW